MCVNTSHKYDDVIYDAIEETVWESAHEDAARFAVQNLICHRCPERLVDPETHLGEELFPKPFACTFIPLVGAPDVPRCGGPDNVRPHG
jgi:hypothetical protein